MTSKYGKGQTKKVSVATNSKLTT